MFKQSNLSVLNYAMAGWTAWHYQTKDSLETVSKNGYFDQIKTICDSGDVIYITFDGKLGKETAIRVINIENGVVKLKNIM